MTDISEITMWASDTGVCTFVSTEDGQYYAVNKTITKDIHFIPLSLPYQEAVERAQEQDATSFVETDLPLKDDPQKLWELIAGLPSQSVLAEGGVNKVLYLQQAREQSWDELDLWFEDSIYEDIVSHHDEISDALGNLMEEEEDPSTWEGEELSRYQYLYLPHLKRLYGAYLAGGESFIEHKEDETALYWACAHLYEKKPFLLIADDYGEPEIYRLDLTDEEALELVSVGDWDTLSEGAQANARYPSRNHS